MNDAVLSIAQRQTKFSGNSVFYEHGDGYGVDTDQTLKSPGDGVGVDMLIYKGMYSNMSMMKHEGDGFGTGDGIRIFHSGNGHGYGYSYGLMDGPNRHGGGGNLFVTNHNMMFNTARIDDFVIWNFTRHCLAGVS